MKKLFVVLFALLCTITCARAENFYIKNYDIDININQYNEYVITEDIDVYFTNSSHGIFRRIPLVNNVVRSGGKRYTTRANIYNTYVSENYSTNKNGNNYVIKIGDPDRFVSGNHSYKIKYLYSLNAPNNEVYFNIIGTNWDTNIDKVKFKITMPKPFPYDKVGLSVGRYGTAGFSEGRAQFSVNPYLNTIEGTILKPLSANEGVTIRIELPKGYFYKKYNAASTFCVFLITLFLFISFIFWFAYGKDDKTIPVVNFYPPDNLNSALVGLIYSERVDMKQVVSLIIYLADKGYIKIKDFGTSVEFEKLKEYDGNDVDLKLLMDALFENNTSRALLASLETSKTFYKKCEMIKNNLNKEKKMIYEKDSIALSTKIPVIFSNVALVLILLVILLDFNFNVDDALPLIMLSLFPIFGILTIYSVVKKSQSAFAVLPPIIFSLIHGGIPLCAMFAIAQNSIMKNLNLFIYCLVALIISFVCLYNLPKKSKYGQVLKGQILGFKKFIETAEADRIRALVKENPSYCFAVLSYAYVLGISKLWIEKFEKVVAANIAWYDGDFNYYSFNRFTTSAHKASCPSVENGGITYSSSSGGGGFSGGGSGGGGGGSW